VREKLRDIGGYKWGPLIKRPIKKERNGKGGVFLSIRTGDRGGTGKEETTGCQMGFKRQRGGGDEAIFLTLLGKKVKGRTRNRELSTERVCGREAKTQLKGVVESTQSGKREGTGIDRIREKPHNSEEPVGHLMARCELKMEKGQKIA